jgi:hypothetical protein
MDLHMPEPTTKNLDKASRDELVKEVVNLRQFVGLLLENLKDFRAASGLNEEQNHRLLELETGLKRLENVARQGREKLLPELETRMNQKFERIDWSFNQLNVLSATHDGRLDTLLTLVNDLRKRVEYLEKLLPYPKPKERELDTK